MVESAECGESKIRAAQKQEQEQDAVVSQNRLAAGSFLIPVGGNDFRDANQGKDKGVDSKTLEDEMFCNKQADDKMVNGAV